MVCIISLGVCRSPRRKGRAISGPCFPKPLVESMKHLPLPDKWHLYAAQGWVGLGDHAQANEELEKIAPELSGHPDVLEVRLRICSHANNWEACVDIAGAILKLDPSRL